MQASRLGRLSGGVIACALWLAGCGGGGSGATEPPSEAFALYPTEGSDSLPPGARIDVAARNLFPLASGNTWVYDRTSPTQVDGVVTRRALHNGGTIELSEEDSIDASLSGTGVYQLGPQGLTLLDPTGSRDQLPGLYQALPSQLEYATPFYPVDAVRQIVRQGNLQKDLDGDAKHDYFRYEYTQVFKGFVPKTVLGRTVEVAWFTNTLVLSVRATLSPKVTHSSRYIEQVYLAPGLGVVRAERSAVDGNGATVVAPYTMNLRSAVIDGVSHVGPSGTDVRTAIALEHRDLVFDAIGNRYYASVASSVVGNGNRIAIIDPANGALTFSDRTVGSEPDALAVSEDGRWLYVGLRGSGEVLRLALPALTEAGRVRLPADAFLGQMVAEQIAVSPASADVAAVSLALPGYSPRHGGVVLLRDMVAQPLQTQQHTGGNRIGFDRSGANLYGYNNETTEFGLRRIEVLATGLAEREVVATGGGFGSTLDSSAGLVMVGGLAYATPALLSRGAVSGGRHCRKLSWATKVVCLGTLPGQLVVADTGTFSILAQPAYGPQSVVAATLLVPGPVGQVAVGNGATITLFADPSLN